MSAARLIKKYGQKVTVKRDKNAEAFLYGKRIEDEFNIFTITASVQPLRPDEVVDESQGSERNRHAVRLYTSVELKTVDEKNGFKADIIVYRGDEFEITQVDDWTENKRTLQHYKAIGQLINRVGKK